MGIIKSNKRSPRAAAARSPRPRAFSTDIRRTITGNPKRFISLFIITALGATMLVGLKAACDDLRATADSYYDAQRLFDISVQSTLGLDQDDIDALDALEGVETAEGGYTETAYTEVADTNEKVDLKALSTAGLNEPLVVAGRLPRDVGEVAVTQKYLDASGKQVGDTVTFEGAADEEDAGTMSALAEVEEATEEGVEDGDAADSSGIFKRGEYTITGAVLDPMDVNAGSKTMSFRASSGSKYAFFFTPAAVEDRDTFTIAYITAAGAAELPCYSDEYEELVAGVKREVEEIRAAREDARTDGVKDAANAKIDELQGEADEKIADAEGQLADAQAQIDDALAAIASGRLELDAQSASAAAQIAAAQREIDANRKKLDAGLATIDTEQAKLDAGRKQAEDALAQIAQAESGAAALATQMGDAWPEAAWQRLLAGDASAKAPFVAAISSYADEAAGQLETYIGYCDTALSLIDRVLEGQESAEGTLLARLDELEGELSARYPDYADEIAAALAEAREALAGTQVDEGALVEVRDALSQVRSELAAQVSQLDALPATAGQLADAALGKKQAESALAQIDAGQSQLDAARAEANYGLGRLDAAQSQLDAQSASASEQISEGVRQLEEGAAEAAAGQAELDEGRSELEEQKADAEARFADARSALDDIDRATWYIQDRSSLSSYSTVESDASSIESIATVFPLIFFTVAVLISLTTVTRMVEEDRGLIGVYKALGYSRGRILSKYLIYAFAACLTGGIAGDALGFIALPEVIFTIFTTMYDLPAFQLHFNALSALAGIGLFAIGIVGATFIACSKVLRENPASLMRPRAPKAGKRILLERIRPLWRRMSFLNKVSARNLFRYKKRAFMTVFGIAGCTALMICGLGIRDTVISLKPRQYGEAGIVRYDLMAVTADADFERGRSYLEDSDEVEQLLEARVDTVTAEFGAAKESVQIMVVPDNADLSAYMKVEDESGGKLELPRDGAGALITKNAEQVLGFTLGDEVTLQDSTLSSGTVRIDGVVLNYLGNFVFMTESAYAEAFGEQVVPNAFLVNLSGTDAEKIAFADTVADEDAFVTVSSSTKIANDFSEAFKIIDVVVYVVTVMAAALAFAVVFTLSTTNISERERELATIKVLGFRRREVYRYINKETVVLALIGVVAGFPMGWGITRFLTYVLRMPSLFFDTLVEPPTYAIAAAASLLFVLVVNKITNRSLDRIVMVEALKSAE